MIDLLESSLIRIVARGQGNLGWHDIGVQLSMLDVPRDRDMLATLKALAGRDLLRERVDGNRDRWEVTDAGLAALASELPPELGELATVLRGDLPARVAGLRDRLDDPEVLVRQLGRLLELTVGLEDGIAFAASVLPEPHRTELLVDLSRADSVATRRALFRLWAPLRFVRPGQRPIQLSDSDWEQLIRRGLQDSDREVRAMAAGLAFDTDYGAVAHAELVANAAEPKVELRRTALLALGSAADTVSLRTLRRAVAGEDPIDAACAVRALAARSDGLASLWAALDDPREQVHEAALFALRWVVPRLDPARVETLSSRQEPDLQDALRGYLARMEGRAGG